MFSSRTVCEGTVVLRDGCEVFRLDLCIMVSGGQSALSDRLT